MTTKPGRQLRKTGLRLDRKAAYAAMRRTIWNCGQPCAPMGGLQTLRRLPLTNDFANDVCPPGKPEGVRDSCGRADYVSRARHRHCPTRGRSDGHLHPHARAEEAQFIDVDLQGARFVEADLSGVVIAPSTSPARTSTRLAGPRQEFLVNGVDVIPLVEASLNHRFPGRATDAPPIRTACAPPGRPGEHWTQTLNALRDAVGSVDVSVDGEWSFAQTLRHLILATDAWMGRGILELDQPFHPFGLAGPDAEDDGLDLSVFTTDPPSYAEVLKVRAGRVAMMRDYLASASSTN